jgi:DMSO/TMAO reductase YedYZ molybdopterin-dependent catalytic subunit
MRGGPHAGAAAVVPGRRRRSVDRRRLIAGTLGLGAAVAAATGPTEALARVAVLSRQAAAARLSPEQIAAINAQLPGTPWPLAALPGKGMQGRVYDVPPNYEIPTIRLIGNNAPYTDTAYYYVRSSEAYPAVIAPDAARLEIGGDRATKPTTYTLADLQRFPRREVGVVGQCGGFGGGLLRPLTGGTPWTKGDVSCAVWSGCSLNDVLDEVGIGDGAIEVEFVSASTGLSRKNPHFSGGWDPRQLREADAVLAWQVNGGEIPIWNGAPLRVIMPGYWAPNWVKALAKINILSDTGTPDYDPHGGMHGGIALHPRLSVCSLVATPADGTLVPVGGRLDLRGVAWDDGQGIAKVETSTDDGATWTEAALEPQATPFAWRVWTQTVTIDRAGPFPVLVRATNGAGVVQDLDNPADEAEGDTTSARKLAAIFQGV